MQEAKKLTTEELESIDSIRKSTSDKISQFGEIELELIYLDRRKEQLLKIKNDYKQELDSVQQAEIELSKSLEEKYGQGTLNLDNGEFLPA